jgi:DNA replication protein DnaC
MKEIIYDDILTEHEKADAVAWAIKKEKENRFFRLIEKGMPVESVELRMAQIDWNQEINQAEVLAAANRRKHFRQLLEQEQETEKQLNALQNHNLVKEWDCWKFYDTMKDNFVKRFGVFKGKVWQRQYIQAVCWMMARDGKFETKLKFSFTKGLLVKGISGIGKTEIIRSVSENPVMPIKIISILDISDMVKENGLCDLNMNERILIDDVGTEPEIINHFGTKVNWFKDFIEKYYLHANGNFSKLLITTNLTGDDFEARYGLRVRSRMREMFNVINLAGNDLRK